MPPLSTDYPYYIIVEFLGGNQEKDSEQFELILADAFERSLIVDGVLAKTEAECLRLWDLRDNPEPIEMLHDNWACFDISLRITDMEKYSVELKKLIAENFPVNDIYIYGHLGDGNLHIAIWVEENGPQIMHDIEHLVYEHLQGYHGSISAEHGVGLEKKEWLHYCRSPSEMDVMKGIKRVMDSKNILNPGKIFTLN